jgi:hypothetical protein
LPRFYLTLALLTALMLSGPSLRHASAQQPPENHPGNGSASTRVHLIPGGSAQFDAVFQEHFPDAAGSPQNKAIRATSAIVVNDTQFRVTAITLQWTVVHSDGSRQVLYSSIFPGVTSSHLLSSRDTVLDQNHLALVSPVAHEEETDSAGSPRGSRVRNAYATLDAKYSNTDLVTSLFAAKEIDVKIDGIVFGTGVFTGKDNYGLQQKFTCEHNGAIDEALAVKTALERGASAQSVMESDVATGLTSTDADGSCLAARGREASRLIEVLQKGGNSQLLQTLASLSQAQRITLRRLP